MWNSIEREIIEVPIDVPLLVNVSSTAQYMVIKRIINTRSRYSFYFIMLFEMNPKILEIYSSVTNVFVLCVVFLLIVYFFNRLSTVYVGKKKNKILKMKQKEIIEDNFISSNFENEFKFKTIRIENPYEGKVTEAIEKLRILQLMNSDDIHLNNSIDEAIDEMTKNEEDLFSIQFEKEEKSKNQKIELKEALLCPFCPYLFDKNRDLLILKMKNDANKKKKDKVTLESRKTLNFYLNGNKNDKKNQLFNTWKIKMNSFINIHFDEVLLNTNPHKYLVLKFI